MRGRAPTAVGAKSMTEAGSLSWFLLASFSPRKEKVAGNYQLPVIPLNFVEISFLPSNIETNRVRFSFPREDPSSDRKGAQSGAEQSWKDEPNRSWAKSKPQATS